MTDQQTLLEAIQRSNQVLIQTLFAFAEISDHLHGENPGQRVELSIGQRHIGSLPVSIFHNAAQHSGWLDRRKDGDDVR